MPIAFFEKPGEVIRIFKSQLAANFFNAAVTEIKVLA